MAIPDKFKKIDDSFKTGYETNSNKELIHKLNIHPETTPQEIIKAELTRRLIDEIDNFNGTSSKYSKVIIGLTIALGIIAILQLVILFK